MGLVYPCFESRAEIARAGRGARARRRLAARSRRRAALSGHAAASAAAEPTRRDRDRARPMRCGWTWRPRWPRAGRSTWQETARARRRNRRHRRPSRSLGRCRAGAQGDADQLPSVGGRRRRAAGRDRRGARPGSLSRHRVHRLLQALLELPQPRYRHHRLILDEGGHKLRNRVRRPVCASCVPQGLRRTRFAAESACPEAARPDLCRQGKHFCCPAWGSETPATRHGRFPDRQENRWPRRRVVRGKKRRTQQVSAAATGARKKRAAKKLALNKAGSKALTNKHAAKTSRVKPSKTQRWWRRRWQPSPMRCARR